MTVNKTHFATWAEVEAHLDLLGMFNMRPGQESISGVLRRLNLLTPPFPAVQIVGTNGKGSTSTFIASLGRAHGMSVGLATSPHFVTVRERAKIFRPSGSPGGDVPDEKAWLDASNTLMANGGEALSYFEFVTAAAMILFHAAGVDLAVLETGLGGSYDATTAINLNLVVYTPIALDHQSVLGDTLAEIAHDKSGAMRRNGTAISAVQLAEVQEQLEIRAKDWNVRLLPAPDHAILPDAIRAGQNGMFLQGFYQLDNAALALAAWHELVRENHFEDKSCWPAKCDETRGESLKKCETEGLLQAWIPGRMQFVPACYGAMPPHPAVILDGAHNEHGISALGLGLAKRNIAPGAVIFSCLADKHPEKVVPHLRALATGPIFVPHIADNPRAMDSRELADMIGLNATPVESFQDALAQATDVIRDRIPQAGGTASAPKNPLLVCGSLYMLSEFFTLYPQYLEPAYLTR